MADGGYFGRARRKAVVLHRMDNSRARQKQHHHNQDRDDGPGQLDLIAAVNLCRLATVIAGAPAEFHHRISKQAKYYGKDDEADFQHKQ